MPEWERLYLDDFDAWNEAQIATLNRHKTACPTTSTPSTSPKSCRIPFL